MIAILLSIACGLSITSLHLGSASRFSGLPKQNHDQVDEGHENWISSSLPSTRTILEAANRTVVTQVSNFDELVKAMEDGYQDIEITQHMDATARGLIAAPIQGIMFSHQLPPQTSKTRSIRGACSQKPSAEFLNRISGEPLLPVKPKQCVILSSQAVMPLAAGQVWFDNVYLRHAKASIGEAVEASKPPAPLHVHSGQPYITNVTIQGDGDSQVAGVKVFPSANVLMIDSIIANAKLNRTTTNELDKGVRRSLKQDDNTDTGKAPPVVIVQGSPAFFLRADFQDIVLPADGHVVLADQAIIKESTFSNVSAERPLGAIGRAAFYADNTTLEIGNNAGAAAEPANPTPLSRAIGLTPAHLTQFDAFFVNLQLELASDSATRMALTEAEAAGVGLGVTAPSRESPPNREIPPTQEMPPNFETPTPRSDGSSSRNAASTPDAGVDGTSEGGANTGVVVGAIIAAAILIVGCFVGALWYLNNKQRRTQMEKEKEKEERAAREAAQNQYGTPSQFGSPSFAHPASWGPPSQDGKASYGVPLSYNNTNFSNASSAASSHPGSYPGNAPIYRQSPHTGQGAP